MSHRNEIPEGRNRRHVVRLAAAVLATAAAPIALSGKSHAAGRHLPTDPSDPLCLLAGTRVMTVRGEVAVQDLARGDLIVTEFGGLRPVVWIGRTTYRKQAGESWAPSIDPVRIARSAVADGVPARDVVVSPEHALLIDGYLIPAKLLVNGATISQNAHRGDVIDYFHVECDGHDVMFAEGLPVETLRALEGYASFDNADEAADVHGRDAKVLEPCAPVLGYWNARQDAMALVRHATSICFDLRDPIQVAFDRLAERATSLALETIN